MTPTSTGRPSRVAASHRGKAGPRLSSESGATTWVRDRGSVEVVSAGTELLREDTVPDDVLWIEDGIVALQRRGHRGAPVLIGLRFPGWIVGAESAIVSAQTPVTAIALTPCRLHRMSRETFVRLIKSDANLSWRVNEMFGREAFDTMTRATESRLPPQHRLRLLLKRLIEANEATTIGKTIRLQLPFDDAHLAQLLAVPPASIPRLFAQLEAEEYLTVDRDGVIITSPRRLRQAHLNDVGWPINARRRDTRRGPAAKLTATI